MSANPYDAHIENERGQCPACAWETGRRAGFTEGFTESKTVTPTAPVATPNPHADLAAGILHTIRDLTEVLKSLAYPTFIISPTDARLAEPGEVVRVA